MTAPVLASAPPAPPMKIASSSPRSIVAPLAIDARHGNGLVAQASRRHDWIPVMEHQGGADQESEAAGNRADEQQAREREALKRRVRESLLRCPGAETSRPA
jgi:hypothetical protein